MKQQRGGPGKGQGRKPVKQGEETVTVSLRMTPDQRAKLALLGGAEWVRQKIDSAESVTACHRLKADGGQNSPTRPPRSMEPTAGGLTIKSAHQLDKALRSAILVGRCADLMVPDDSACS